MEQFDGTLIDSASIKPRYLRVRDAVRYSSIPYTTFYEELIKGGLVRTSVLFKKGNKAGIRLVDIRSLDEFLARHAEGGTPEKQQPTVIAIPPLRTRKTTRHRAKQARALKASTPTTESPIALE
jgi:hypothetical protein